jgi:hypothetical protein
MAASESQRRPCNRYVEYLNLYTRRIRRSPSNPANDGAGLLYGTKYNGRVTPLKGKGLPPPDNKETPAMVGGLRMVNGRSAGATDPLATVRPLSAADLEFRPSVRYYRKAFASSMSGTGAVVVSEVRAPAGRGGVRGLGPARGAGARGDPIGGKQADGAAPLLHRPSAMIPKAVLWQPRPSAGTDAHWPPPPSKQDPEKRAVRRHGEQAPLDGVDHTRTRVHADSEWPWWKGKEGRSRMWHHALNALNRWTRMVLAGAPQRVALPPPPSAACLLF